MKKEDPGIVAHLERFDAPSVSAYREAVRLSVYYSASSFSVNRNKSKHQADRWRDAAHRILMAAIDNLKKIADK